MSTNPFDDPKLAARYEGWYLGEGRLTPPVALFATTATRKNEPTRPSLTVARISLLIQVALGLTRRPVDSATRSKSTFSGTA